MSIVHDWCIVEGVEKISAYNSQLLPDKIRQLREERKLSQDQLAVAIGMKGKQAVCNWEANSRKPNIETLWQLADFFGVSVDYLIGRSDDPTKLP
jgi:transcriptional regulator with XRE-family HTH domain